MTGTESRVARWMAAVGLLAGLGTATPASAGIVYDFFFSSAEGLLDIDEAAVTSLLPPNLSPANGYVAFDRKTETVSTVEPELFEFADGTLFGFALVSAFPDKLVVGVEVPVVGRHRLMTQETEFYDSDFGYLGETTKFALQAGFKGKAEAFAKGGPQGVQVSVSATIIAKGQDEAVVQQRGRLKVGISKLHKGSSILVADVGTLSVAEGLFLGVSPLESPKPGSWTGPTIFDSGYPLVVRGGSVESGGSFKLSAKPNKGSKLGTYNLSAKQGRRKYSERGFVDITEGELGDVADPEALFSEFDFLNSQYGFTSGASRETYRAKIQK